VSEKQQVYGELKKTASSSITSQDGSYRSELLFDKGYEVRGIIGRSSSFNTERIDRLFKDIYNVRLFIHFSDPTDSSNMNRVLDKTARDESYNLGAQSHIKVSFEVPEYTAEADAIGTL
jgi:GDPmannose 4,6-dehydratase